jgi:hypothetical protein
MEATAGAHEQFSKASTSMISTAPTQITNAVHGVRQVLAGEVCSAGSAAQAQHSLTGDCSTEVLHSIALLELLRHKYMNGAFSTGKRGHDGRILQPVPGTLHPAYFNVATALWQQLDKQLPVYLLPRFGRLASECTPSFTMHTKRTRQCC